MRIIIAGDGEVGFYLAQLLSKDDHAITVIDPEEEFISMVSSHSDILAVSGDPTSPEVLLEANIKRCELFISVVHDERTNILAASMAKNLGARKTIARINNVEYLEESQEEYFRSIGVDHLVCPERLAADEIVRLLGQTAATEYYDFADGKLLFLLIRIEKNSKVVDMRIDEVALLNPKLDFRTIAIHRDQETIIPRGKDTFHEDDLVYVISKPEGLSLLMELSGKTLFEVKNLMIIGGGRIGQKTSLRLQDEMNIKLIDYDMERCEGLSRRLAKTLIINGDARSIELLKDEDIAGMDAFVAVTDDSETNILSCLLAMHFGVKRVIPLLENIEYINISQNIGLDTTINKKLITASHIARYTMDSWVSGLRCLHGIDAEAFEFVVQQRSKVTKKKIRDIGFPKDAIIGGIVRGEEVHIAFGEFQIAAGDTVVVFALPSAFNKVESYFN
ncbi:MAG: Trk system potassium transporter TrkA [Bacteroidetes bacterium HGW-Bacteroidetes-6]|jgi:trk system potassium uptake protein TrkA|nr:MAG: Trk system potassium transporter TrkA [Bacteroidetes bacterium HGW-Bacteroidetes-6]